MTSAERRAALYEGRKGRGQCVRCGTEAVPGTTQCFRHTVAARACAERHRTNRRSRGLCSWMGCTSPAETGSRQCRRHQEGRRDRHTALKAAVFAGYGNKCSNCPEADPNVLQLDHVNNDGNTHRKEVGSGANTMWWAKKHGFPPVLQLLCANCHAAKTVTGSCAYRRDPAPACRPAPGGAPAPERVNTSRAWAFLLAAPQPSTP